MERKTLSHHRVSSRTSAPRPRRLWLDIPEVSSDQVSVVYFVSGAGGNGDYLKQFICSKLLCVGDNCGQTSHHVLVCCGQPAADVLSSFRTLLLLIKINDDDISEERKTQVLWRDGLLWLCYDMDNKTQEVCPGGGETPHKQKKDATVIWAGRLSHSAPGNTESRSRMRKRILMPPLTPWADPLWARCEARSPPSIAQSSVISGWPLPGSPGLKRWSNQIWDTLKANWTLTS